MVGKGGEGGQDHAWCHDHFVGCNVTCFFSMGEAVLCILKVFSTSYEQVAIRLLYTAVCLCMNTGL